MSPACGFKLATAIFGFFFPKNIFRYLFVISVVYIIKFLFIDFNASIKDKCCVIGTTFIFGDLNTDNSSLNIIKNTEPLCVLIGPEGDFTEKEREKILELKNLISLKINENILRSETAAISMISIVTFNFLS